MMTVSAMAQIETLLMILVAISHNLFSLRMHDQKQWKPKRLSCPWKAMFHKPTVTQRADHLNTLAIVIVSWNAKGYLLDCLRSIHEHPFHSSLEVVVVDNHSSDGSPKAVAEQFPQVTLIRNGTNLGFARGNNLGITQTNSRYVALINSDVVVLPGCLNRLVEYMDAHPEVGLCGPRILNPDGSLQPSCRKKPRLWGSLCTTFSLHQLFRRSCFSPVPS